MPTARELLEQADALMRRNRARAIDTEIPELTEAVPDAVLLPLVPAALDQVPELVDVVEEIEIASIAELPEDRGVPSEWLRLEPDVAAEPLAPAVDRLEGEAPVTEDAGHSLPIVPAEEPAIEGGPAMVEPASAAALAETAEVVASSPTANPDVLAEAAARATAAESAHPAGADDWARWQAIAEEIRMQVLQRIDIFTDTGLREQLAAQLQPIVDRASTEMVATVNEQVGTLLRAYIAEAIEREIQKWRAGNT